MEKTTVLLLSGIGVLLLSYNVISITFLLKILFLIAKAIFLLLLGFSVLTPFALTFRELPKHKPRRGLLNERFSLEKIDGQKYDAIIIGSGMGGLTCAATLSRFGYRVLVLEQHEIAGGGTHTFFIDGKTDYEFDSGLHYTVPQSAELLQLACGTRHKPVEVSKMGEPDGCFDKVVLGDPAEEGLRVKHAQGHLSEIRKMFPDEKDQRELDEFLRISNKINNFIPLWLISKVLPLWARKYYKKLVLKQFSKYASQTGEEVTTRLLSNKKMTSLLLGLWMNAGCPPHRHSFVMTAALAVGFPKEGGAFPDGGSKSMASCLVQAIELNGGKVLMRARVKEILVDSKSNSAYGVRMDDDEETEIYSKTVVCAAGYGNLYTKLLPESAVPEGYVRKEKTENGLRHLPKILADSGSFVMANVGIKANPEEAGIGCYNIWIMPCSEENGFDLFQGTRDFFEDQLKAQNIPLMITFPSIKDRKCKLGEEKQRLACQLLVPVESSWFKEWENELEDCSIKSHPEDGEYMQLKKQWKTKLTEILLKRYPNFKDKIDFFDVSTPLSVKYYLNKSGAGAVGLDVTPSRFYDDETERLLDMKTPINGLWLTGEDALLCGQPLAQLSGILTSWRIVGLRKTFQFVLWIIHLAISDLFGL